MTSRPRLAIYIAFLVALAVWLGGGVFDTISSHPTWYANPVAYVRGPAAIPEGMVNPWPFTTAALGLLTLASIAAFARYRGHGRREVLTVLAGVFIILIATGVYFVPTLIRFANHAALSDAQVTSMSLMWMRLNVIRILLLLALFVYALIGLMRLAQPRLDPARS
jgi:cytochrome bd-type quinol oxidase subunit 2